jgi:uncharacterized peroxidase-related enzyme
MPHIDLPPGLPGLLGPMAFSPETAGPLSQLTEILMRGENSLTPAERELIATSVSSENDCLFCQASHGAAAAHHLGGDEQLVEDVKRDYCSAEVSEKLRALLIIAGKVRVSGREVTTQDVERARELGATDREIHDTVLIAAAFCMFNRYVDGLGTWTSPDPRDYRDTGALLAERGYVEAAQHLARMMGTEIPAERLAAVPSAAEGPAS